MYETCFKTRFRIGRGRFILSEKYVNYHNLKSKYVVNFGSVKKLTQWLIYRANTWD